MFACNLMEQSTFEGRAILVALAGSCFPVTPAINACQQFIPILKNEENTWHSTQLQERYKSALDGQ